MSVGMTASVAVRIGDVIEFAPEKDQDDVRSSGLRTGRVVSIDATEPHVCVVQISPHEPFQVVDLARTVYKIVYGVGDLMELTADMVGWEVEIVSDEAQCAISAGVIKQVDREMNCALIAFGDGRKDWVDLTLSAFKVGCRTTSKVRSAHSPSETATANCLPHLELSPLVASLGKPLPVCEVTAFDWYTEGGHVELCDTSGQFCEGALLCSKKNTILQLYNETRQFFEIEIVAQSFKVVIHGLLTLKTIPMGQSIEIYSPMHGQFRGGTVMKTAELDKLTPIRFSDVGIEWIDLTSQTFKLVFLAPDRCIPSARVSVCSDTPVKATTLGTGSILVTQNVEVIRQSNSPAVEPIANVNHQSKNCQSESQPKGPAAGSPMKHVLQLPVLHVGQQIELFDTGTKQYLKYKVVALSSSTSHKYDLQQVPGCSGIAAISSIAKELCVNLTDIRGRVLVPTNEWDTFRGILYGHRVDVYDKVQRAVIGGTVMNCSVEGEDPSVQVKLKDGSMRWFNLRKTKLKLRLTADSRYEIQSRTENRADLKRGNFKHTAMWERVHQNRNADGASQENDYNACETRPQEKLPTRRTTEQSMSTTKSAEMIHVGGIIRMASSPNNLMSRGPERPAGTLYPRKVPGLNLSLLRPPTANSSNVADVSTSTKMGDQGQQGNSMTEGLADSLPAMDEIWLEEPETAESPVRYVCLATSETRLDTPEWIKRVDAATQESVIIHTATGTTFQLPGSNRSTPQSSGRVVLPVGPLEAVRVANQIVNSGAPE